MDWFDSPTGGGLARSEIAMFQAFSSVGKTTVGLNIIRNNPHIPTLMFSLEMNWRMVAARLAAMEMACSTQDIERVLKAGGDVPGLQAVADKFHDFVCDDTPSITLKAATVAFERATERCGTPPRLVLFDYLELVGGSGGLSGKSEQVDKISAKLRDWTREHDCSTIVLHQLSQGTGGWKPMAMHDGRYGGYQPMDFVAGAYAPRLNPDLPQSDFEQVKEDIFFQLLKQRNGAPDPVGKRYRLDAKTMRIGPHGQIRDYRPLGEAPQRLEHQPSGMPTINPGRPEPMPIEDEEEPF
jgi:replicative DNA helicase